jgi:hypothetical protein
MLIVVVVTDEYPGMVTTPHLKLTYCAVEKVVKMLMVVVGMISLA